MNSFLKCFISVVIVSGYIAKTEAMGLCGFQRRFQDKIRKTSDCNCKNKTNATSASVDMVTQEGGSTKRVELITSSSRDMLTTASGMFSLDPLCIGKMVDEPFVNENCTQRCVCDVIGELICSNYSCGVNSTCGVEDGVRECHCNDGFIRRGQNCSRPTACHDLYSVGIRENGIYTVYPSNWSSSSMQVYCNMNVWPQGGWTVFQRRVNGSVDFHRNWTEYKNGFGSLDHEFWLGNEALYYLTNQEEYHLRIDIFNETGKYLHSLIYESFRIGNEEAGYRLSELGDVIWNSDGIYDALRYHVKASFSTYDHDNDLNSDGNCAEDDHSGWWFTNCSMCNLNGVYGESQSPGIYWYDFSGGQFNITRSEMKIRPVQ